MAEIKASVLQADLIALAQARIREKGVITRTFTLNVYNDADTTATYWITRTVTYDFRTVVIDPIPAPTAAVIGEKITPDSVFRMKNWVIGNMISKFKAVAGTTKLIDGRV